MFIRPYVCLSTVHLILQHFLSNFDLLLAYYYLRGLVIYQNMFIENSLVCFAIPLFIHVLSSGLGVCILAEFGRVLLYNILVDGGSSEEGIDNSDSEDESNCDSRLRGYKQMLLVLRSQAVETGKSFIAEILLRLYHGKKTTLHSSLSFDSAKVLLGKGEPIVIDDYNNDDLSCIMLSRVSKAVWSQGQITIRNQAITPATNLLICTNENIHDIKVEGRNKEEIYQKFSVVDIGEKPMSSSNCEKKEEMIKVVLQNSKVLRSCLPSLYGVILQACGLFITSEELKEYEHVTGSERLANILKNCKNLHLKLKMFCEAEDIGQPKSIQEALNTSCLTSKSELSHKFRNPEQILEYIMDNKGEIAITHHESKEGITALFSNLIDLPWFEQSFNIKKNGIKVFQKMRTRRLIQIQSKEPQLAFFLSFEFLKPGIIEQVKEYVTEEDDEREDEEMEDEEEQIDPRVVIANDFEASTGEYEKRRKERFSKVEDFVKSLVKLVTVDIDAQVSKFACGSCGFVAKNKGGLTIHMKKCKKK